MTFSQFIVTSSYIQTKLSVFVSQELIQLSKNSNSHFSFVLTFSFQVLSNNFVKTHHLNLYIFMGSFSSNSLIVQEILSKFSVTSVISGTGG